ncbi:hypothetical protein TNCV_176061 [Trichonephila clavipes]|nr:hypothetical protein TNCV_176061 [Trichonephila clavipes]
MSSVSSLPSTHLGAREKGASLLHSDQYSTRAQTTRNAPIAKKLEKLIIKDRRLTFRETAEQFEISKGSLHTILCDHMQIACEMYSQILSVGQKELRLAVAQNLLKTIKVEHGFLRLLAITEKENVIDRIPFSE